MVIVSPQSLSLPPFHHLPDSFSPSSGGRFVYDDVVAAGGDEFRFRRRCPFIIVQGVIKAAAQGAAGAVPAAGAPPHAINAVAEPAGNGCGNQYGEQGTHGGPPFMIIFLK